MNLPKTTLLGVGVTNATTQQILEYILNSFEKSEENYYITTPNPEILVYAKRNPSFKTILNRARLALADGIGVTVAAQILSKPLHGRTTGVEMVEMLCKEAGSQPITVGFLGGKGKIAELTAQCLVKKYPHLRVVLAHGWDPTPQTASSLKKTIEEYFAQSTRGQNFTTGQDLLGKKDKKTSDESLPEEKIDQRVSKDDNTEKLDVLFIAYGFPKQEQFMAEYISTLPVKVMIGVGGAFDYISGTVPRAPKVVRTLGFEWLFRLLLQPWRIKRQVALLEFIWLILQERFSK